MYAYTAIKLWARALEEYKTFADEYNEDQEDATIRGRFAIYR